MSLHSVYKSTMSPSAIHEYYPGHRFSLSCTKSMHILHSLGRTQTRRHITDAHNAEQLTVTCALYPVPVIPGARLRVAIYPNQSQVL